MKTEKINNIKITPLITHTKDKKDVLGGKYFLNPYSNCAIISKKCSGKTTLLYHILKNVCRGGNYPTNVIIFAATINRDDTYKYIIEMLENKGCNVNTFTNFIEEGEDIVSDLLDHLSKNDECSPVCTPTDFIQPDLEKIGMFGRGIQDLNTPVGSAVIPPKPPKKIAAEYVLVFDDLGKMMACKTIARLSKIFRHYKMRCFYLQQYLTDLLPETRKQIDYAILFKSFNKEKLEDIYESLDLSISFEDFVKFYNYATEEPYNFLYIDVVPSKFRKNFDTELIEDTI